jgi:hypothetical protein
MTKPLLPAVMENQNSLRRNRFSLNKNIQAQKSEFIPP